KPQKGVTYFVCGSSGQLRRGNLDKRSPITAAGFDQDEAFLVVDVEAERMNYRAISRTGSVVDSGEIRRGPVTTSAFSMRRSEAMPTAWLSMHLFLTIASTVLGKSARDALFLTHYSPQYMTAADVGTAVAAALALGAQLRLVAALSTKRVLLLS